MVDTTIPQRTAIRGVVPGTYDPLRRPGSSGQRYFSDIEYVTNVEDPAAQTAANLAAQARRNEQATGLQALNLSNLAREQRPDQVSTATAPSTQVPYYTPSGQNTSGISNFLDTQKSLVSEASRRFPIGMTPAQRSVTGALTDAPNDMVARLINMGIFTPETAAQFYQSRYPGLTAEQVQAALAQYAPAVSTGQMGPQQQTLTVNGMAQGGLASVAPKGMYLGGPTDGMADQIPATIDNKQPAALSDGEFVVPADVVSHLGNGNSDAGAQQLYSMMERVRKARTGNPEQGRQIDPNKYLG